jgi:hypothetical protein
MWTPRQQRICIVSKRKKAYAAYQTNEVFLTKITETTRTVPQQSLVMVKSNLFRLLRGDVRGQGLVEYLLALSLIAFATVAAEQTFAC